MLRKRLFRVVGVIVTVAALGMVVRGDAPRLPLQEPRVRKASPIVDPFLVDLQERTFRFFWDTANPRNGLVPDRYPIAVVLEHRRDRLRAHGLSDRRRARLRHARAGARRACSPRCASCATRRKGRDARGVTGYKGFFYHFLDMKTGAALRGQRAVDRRHRAPARRRAVLPVLLRRPTMPTRRRSAASPTRSTGASTGAGRRCARRRSAWAGRRKTAFIAYDWRATTRRCWSTCSRSARRRQPVGTGRLDRVDEHATTSAWGTLHRPGAPRASRRCSVISTRTSGSISAASRTRTCAGAASTTSRTAAARSTRSAPTRSPIRWAGKSYGANVWGLTASDGPADMTLTGSQGAYAPLSDLLRRAAPAVRRRASTTARSRRPRRSRRCRSRPRS